MYRIIFVLTSLGCAFLFLLSYNVLEMVGWHSLTNANAITKIHPAFYVFVPTAILAVVTLQGPYLRFVSSPQFLGFFSAGVLLTLRAATIASTGVTGGELSAAIVTWLIPAFMLVCLQGISGTMLDRMGIVLRGFFILNSLVGIAERLTSFRLAPSLVEGINDPRATAFFGHPLNASLLTGMMIVHLASARRSHVAAPWRLPEMGLHGLAMFAFGGRSALVFTVATVIASAIIVFQRRGERNVGLIQRLLPLIIIAAGLALVFVPLEFIDTTIDRFTNDYKSSETRNSAWAMLGFLNTHDWLFGMDANRRQIMQTFFQTPYGIELCWVALVMTYGIVATLPMMIALPYLFYTIVRTLDRSAFYMCGYFLVVTAGSLSLGSKSLLVAQTLFMMLTLAQRRIAPAAPPRVARPDIWAQIDDAQPRQAPRPARERPVGAAVRQGE